MASRVWRLCQVLLLTVPICVVTAAVFDVSTESKVREFVDETMKCRNVPGLTVTAVKDNDTWTQGFGTADFDTGRLVDGKSLFGIGSVTKAFTMTLLAGLLDDHGFNWTSKLSDVLGHRFEFVDELRTQEMTIRDLLSHRTGLARLDVGLFAGLSRAEISREQFVRKYKYLPAAHPFRDQFLYNNYMYTLLGHVCETLGGDTWQNLLRTRLLIPIGMTSTVILEGPRDLERPNMAKPYMFYDGGFQNGTAEVYDIYPSEPAGAILSSAEDMAKWIKFNLNRGKTEDGKQLIKEDMFAEAIKATTPINDDNTAKKPDFPVGYTITAYGYAWMIANYRGFEVHLHGGGLMSYITMLWIYPDLNIGVFTSVNGPGFESVKTLTAIMSFISDSLLDETPWINTTTTCTFPEPWKKPPAHKPDPKGPETLVNGHDYEGIFRNEFLPPITLSVRNDSSNTEYLKGDMGRMSGTLLPTNDTDRFLFEMTSPRELTIEAEHSNVTSRTNVTFERDGGVVTRATFAFEVDVTFKKEVPVTLDRAVANKAMSIRYSTCMTRVSEVLQIVCALLIKYLNK